MVKWNASTYEDEDQCFLLFSEIKIDFLREKQVIIDVFFYVFGGRPLWIRFLLCFL